MTPEQLRVAELTGDDPETVARRCDGAWMGPADEAREGVASGVRLAFAGLASWLGCVQVLFRRAR